MNVFSKLMTLALVTTAAQAQAGYLPEPTGKWISGGELAVVVLHERFEGLQDRDCLLKIGDHKQVKTAAALGYPIQRARFDFEERNGKTTLVVVVSSDALTGEVLTCPLK